MARCILDKHVKVRKGGLTACNNARTCPMYNPYLMQQAAKPQADSSFRQGVEKLAALYIKQSDI